MYDVRLPRAEVIPAGKRKRDEALRPKSGRRTRAKSDFPSPASTCSSRRPGITTLPSISVPRPRHRDEVASIAGGGGASNLLAPFGDYTPAGLAGYWKLGERSEGLVIPDELGLHDGTMVGHAPTAIDDEVPSDPGAPTDPCS